MSFTGTVRNGVIILPPEARLPEGTEVRVEPVELAPEQDAFLAAVERVAKPRPQWPADYPLNHGHYVSGEPRKP